VAPTPSLRRDVVTSTGASRIIGRAAGPLDLHFHVAHPSAGLGRGGRNERRFQRGVGGQTAADRGGGFVGGLRGAERGSGQE
jgi:hypothetical protein